MSSPQPEKPFWPPGLTPSQESPPPPFSPLEPTPEPEGETESRGTRTGDIQNLTSGIGDQFDQSSHNSHSSEEFDDKEDLFGNVDVLEDINDTSFHTTTPTGSRLPSRLPSPFLKDFEKQFLSRRESIKQAWQAQASSQAQQTQPTSSTPSSSTPQQGANMAVTGSSTDTGAGGTGNANGQESDVQLQQISTTVLHLINSMTLQGQQRP
ncbi:MAG: hypothetical protein MMC33_008903 [Icmadophila ericetorum]|nr:hypothetical protein [Icmadophila ericetorum]